MLYPKNWDKIPQEKENITIPRFREEIKMIFALPLLFGVVSINNEFSVGNKIP